MRSLYFFLVVFLGCLLTSCSSANETEKHSTAQEPRKLLLQGIKYKKLKKSGMESISFSQVVIDSLSNGIRVNFLAGLSDNSFSDIQGSSFNGFFINVEAESEAGKYSLYKKETAKYGERIRTHNGNYIIFPETRDFHLFIPYRKLKLNKGQHKVNLKIQALPLSVSSDSSEFRKLQYISATPAAEASTSFSLKTPDLIRSVITLHGISINKEQTDLSKYDWSFGGPGFPDIYWKVNCGKDVIFSSPSKKNSSSYYGKYSTPEFCVCPSDIIKIQVVDEDKGPFNKQDIIASWEGTIDMLPEKKENMPFGVLQDFILEVSRK